MPLPTLLPNAIKQIKSKTSYLHIWHKIDKQTNKHRCIYMGTLPYTNRTNHCRRESEEYHQCQTVPSSHWSVCDAKGLDRWGFTMPAKSQDGRGKYHGRQQFHDDPEHTNRAKTRTPDRRASSRGAMTLPTSPVQEAVGIRQQWAQAAQSRRMQPSASVGAWTTATTSHSSLPGSESERPAEDVFGSPGVHW
jgi:hypothetical protein